MNVQETKDLVRTLLITYPTFLKDYDEQKRKALVQIWTLIFEPYDYKDIQHAFVKYSRDAHEFPPQPGQLISLIEKEHDMTSSEAWTLVRKAISNGIYGAEEEFAKLPPTIQRAVGSAAELRNIAMMDTADIQTMIQPRFMRSYETTLEREKIMQVVHPERYARLETYTTPILIEENHDHSIDENNNGLERLGKEWGMWTE